MKTPIKVRFSHCFYQKHTKNLPWQTLQCKLWHGGGYFWCGQIFNVSIKSEILCIQIQNFLKKYKYLSLKGRFFGSRPPLDSRSHNVCLSQKINRFNSMNSLVNSLMISWIWINMIKRLMKPQCVCLSVTKEK